MSEKQFTPYEPRYHDRLDDWGVAEGTRVWMASGSFQPVQEIEKGDYVFGITFEIEAVGIDGERTEDGKDRIAHAWRPRLCRREVKGRRTVEARGWQMTFGDSEQQYETRRLVAGGEQLVDTFPIDSYNTNKKPLVRCHTAAGNPRVGSRTLTLQTLDEEWSQEAKEPKYRPTEFTGTQRGDLVSIIPIEAYGGQMGFFNTESREYNRYAYAQVHQVEVVQPKTRLHQLILQPDTQEENDVYVDEGDRPRVNMIAQTPFAKETRKTKIIRDAKAKTMDTIDRQQKSDHEKKSAMKQWDDYVDSIKSEAGGTEINPGGEESREVTQQGAFWETLEDESLSSELEKKYGFKGGFLNGGILLQMPLHPQLDPRK